MAVLRYLNVSLKLLADDFNNGIKSAQKEAKEFEKSIKPSKQLIEDLGVSMAATGALMVGALTAATKSAVDFGDQINDLQKMTGVSTENLSKLGFAAEQSGSSLEGMSTGLRFLAKNMQAAIEGGKDQQASFAALGLSAKDLKAAHGDVNQILLVLADRFKNITDPAERTALAIKLFGKSGAEMLPFLSEGSAGILKMGDAAERAGAIISTEFAQASDKFNDTLVEVKASVMGLSIAIASALLPAIQSLATEAAKTGGELAHFAHAHEELTRVATLAALAIGGAGGILLATTGLLKVLPSLTAAVGFLGGAAGVAATGGLLALGGSLAALFYHINAATNASIDAKQADVDLGAATQKLADQVAAAGGPIIKAHGSLADWNTEVINAARNIKDLNPELSKLNKAHEDAAAAAQKHAKDLEAAAAAAAQFKEQVDELVKSLGKNANEQRALAEAIHVAESRHMSATDIAIGFADSLKRVTEDAAKSGEAINSTIAPYVALQAQLKATEDAHKRMDAAAKEAAIAEEQTLLMIEQETGRAFGNLGQFFNFVQDDLAATNFAIDQNSAAWRRYFTEINRGAQQSDAAMRVFSEHIDQYITNLPIPKPDIPAPSRILGLPGAAEWQQWQRDGQKAIDHTVDNLSRMFTDSIAHGKKLWDAFKSYGANAIASIADTFLSTMLHGFLDPFAMQFGRIMSGILGGVSGGGTGGLIGKGVGALAGLFGIGGSAALTTTIGSSTLLAGGALAAPAIAAPALAGGAAAGGLGATIAGLATNPITIAAAGALAAGLAIHHFVGQGRRSANEFVQGTENPFGTNLANIVDAFGAAKKAGTLTLEEAKTSKDALEKLWGSFKASAQDFAAQGKNESKVVSQSFAHLTEIFGPGLGKIFEDFDSTIKGLAATAGVAVSGKTGSGKVSAIPQTGLAQSASQVFAIAVDKFADLIKSPSVVQNNNYAPVFNVSMGVDQDLAKLVRDEIEPRFMDDMELNSRGVLDRLIRLLRNSGAIPEAA